MRERGPLGASAKGGLRGENQPDTSNEPPRTSVLGKSTYGNQDLEIDSTEITHIHVLLDGALSAPNGGCSGVLCPSYSPACTHPDIHFVQANDLKPKI